MSQQPEELRPITGNHFNPITHPDINVDELVGRLLSLVAKAPEMTTEERALFEQKRQASAKRFEEERYGDLPENTYRILEQGSFVGWYYELEVADEVIVLKHPDPAKSPYKLFGDKALAVAQARAAIALWRGQEAAQQATFQVMWGGKL